MSFKRAIWLWKNNKYIGTINKTIDVALKKKKNSRHY